MCASSLSGRGHVLRLTVRPEFWKVGASSNPWPNVAFSLEITRQWLGSPNLMLGNSIGESR